MEERVYCSRMAGQSFSMPLYLIDPDTKKKELAYQTNAEGKKIIINNQYVPLMRMIKFTNISNSVRLGYYSEFKTSDQDEIEYLEKLCDDPSVKIIRLDTYKKERNPEMWKAEKERDKIKMETETIIKEKDKELDSVKKALSEMQEKLNKIKNKV